MGTLRSSTYKCITRLQSIIFHRDGRCRGVLVKAAESPPHSFDNELGWQRSFDIELGSSIGSSAFGKVRQIFRPNLASLLQFSVHPSIHRCLWEE